MRAENFSRDVQEFLRLLAKHSVRYVLAGGVAVIYHGYARLTGDVDFFYDRSPANAERLWGALLEFWEGSVPAIEGPAELEQDALVLQFGRPPNRIDLLSGVGTLSFEDAWTGRIEESIDVGDHTVPVWVLGLNALRRTKRDAGRPKDLDDLEHLPDSG